MPLDGLRLLMDVTSAYLTSLVKVGIINAVFRTKISYLS